MSENNANAFGELIEEQINVDLNNCFADLMMGKRQFIHLERIEFLEKYIQDVIAITPNNSPLLAKLELLVKRIALAEELIQTNITHREYE